MEYLIMNKKEREQLAVFNQLKQELITQKEAACRLKLSVRWVRKKKQRYFKDGDKGLIHKSRGKQSSRCWKDEERQLLIKLHQENWHGFGPTFSAEKLEELYGIKISKETARKTLIEAKLWDGKKRRSQHRKQRERKEMFGVLIQLDGSPHDWFEGRSAECCMLAFIDDATSQILWLEFATSESTQSLMQATKNYVEKYGIPQEFYTDHGSVFHVNLNNQEGNKKTQWELAVNQLGIIVHHAHSPQAKGRVERCNKTMQDRLIKEMRLKNISSIEQANNFLKTTNFIAKHNQKFAVVATAKGDVHRSAEAYNLSDVFSIKETRVLANDFTIRYNNQIFQLHKQQHANIYPKNKVVVQTDLDGKITLWIRKFKLFYSAIKSRPKVKTEEDFIIDRIQKPSKNSQLWAGGKFSNLSMESRMKSALTAVESKC